MASRPIDEKIVVMKLENEQFKAKAVETTSLFGKLKQALGNFGNTRFDKVTNDLNGIQKSANGINLNTLSSAVDTISGRFSTLGVIATTALTNITNKAVDAGMRIQKSLTTDQIFDGFREYEIKIGAIGTVLSNTEWAGTGLEDVNRVLNDLNTYADKTIYNFGQMTENIGRFTAAGVTIDDSATAIKGLSNLAAASGSNVQQLNTAMYQMSQSMASGKINLMDWNSMVNAGMGGKKTQDALLATAKAMGINVDMSEGFRESISDGWITSEVFLETLKKFGQDESMIEAATKVRTFTGFLDSLKESIGSGWAQSWEIIFGDFEQATVFWTAISNLIGGIFQKQSDARNKMLQNLANGDVLEKFGLIIKNVATPVVQLFKAIGTAFSQAFPPSGALQISKVVSAIEKFTSGLSMSEGTLANVTTIFKGFFSIISTVIQVIKILVSSVTGLMPGFDAAGGGVLAFVARIAEIPIAINEYLRSSDIAEKATSTLKTVFSGLGKVLGGLGSIFGDVASVLTQTTTVFASGEMSKGVIKEGSLTSSALHSIRDAFKWTFDFVKSIDYGGIGSGFLAFFKGVGDVISWVADKFVAVGGFFKNLPSLFGDNQGWILAGGGIAAMSAVVWKAYEVFRDVTQPFKNFSSLLGSSSKTVESLGELFDSAGGSIKAFTLGIHVKSLLTIAIAIGVLAVSFKVLADLDSKQISNGLYMIVGSLAAMVGALTLMSKFDVGGSFGATLAIVAISVAISVLAGAVEDLSEMNYEEMTRGIIGLVAVLGALTGAIVLMSKFGAGFSVGALQFLAIAGAVSIIINAVEKMSEMNPDTINKGLMSVGILLTELAIFIQLASSRSKVFTASAAGILATAGAIWIIVQAMEQIAKIDPGNITKGLITVGALLTMIGLFEKFTGSKGMVATGAGLVLIAGALNALIIPIAALGNMPLEVLAKGVIAMGAALAVLGAAAKLMTTSIAGAAAITLLAVAMNLLILPIGALGAMSWGVILTGITGLALGLAAIGGVAALLGMATLPILGFGVAIMALGAGFMLFGKGLAIFTTMTVASMTVAITAISAFITGFITLLPAITDLLAKITKAVVEVLVTMAPKIADAIGRLIVAILDKIKEYAPQVLQIIGDILLLVLEKLGAFIVDAVEVVLDLLVTLVDTIGSYIPQFIESGTNLILGFLDGLTENIPKIIDSMTEFVITLITTMSDNVTENGPIFIDAWMTLMGEVVKLMISAGLSVVDALFGWIPGVSKVTAQIGETAGEYIDTHFKAVEIGTDKGTDFATALSGTSGDAKTAGEAIGNAGLTGAGSVDATDTGINFGLGFANGISSNGIIGKTISAAKGLASAAYNTIVDVMGIHSPAHETTVLGEHTGQGFANGIESKNKSIVESIFGWLPGMKDATKKVGKETAVEGEKVGSKTVDSVSKGVKKSAKKNAKSVKKTVKDTAKDVADTASKAFKEAMDNADYKLKMGEIDSEGYIAEINKIKASYSKYPKLVQEANLEIKKAEEDVAKHREELRKKEFDASKSFISERKNYNEMSLMDELTAWERVMNRYEKGSSERKEAEKEVYRLKNDINSKLIDMNEDYVNKIEELQEKELEGVKKLNEEYDKAYSERVNKLTDFVGLFSKVAEKDEELTGGSLLTNLKGQFDTLTTWIADIEKLMSRGLEEGLIEVLREMGPSAANEIKALTTLSDTQLTEYADIWRQKNELARTQTTKELEGLRLDTDRQIVELRFETGKQLEIYKNEWLRKVLEIRNGTKEQFVGLNDDMNVVARHAMDGLKLGLESKRGEVMDLARSIADEIAETIASALEVNSPSKVTTRIGEFTGEGLGVGLDNSTKGVVKSAKNLAVNAKDTLNKFIQGLELPELDNELHIKAVVEYDKTALDQMNREMAFIPDLSYTVNTAEAIASKKRQNADNKASVPTLEKTPANDVKFEQNLHFHTREMSPSEVARKNKQASRDLVAKFS